MSPHYDQLFAVRGSAYDQAMRNYPHARDEEFAQVIEAAGLRPGMTVADVPAGGGYLRRYLPAGCHWIGHEPCASFTNHGASGAASTSMLPLPWPDAMFDVVISLAGTHHLDDKRPLFAQLHRVVKPGGRLVLSDVAAGSVQARFLDGFIGEHNSTGHQGAYLDEHTADGLREAGWTIGSDAIRDFLWRFPERNSLTAFCQQLFDLRDVHPSDTLAAIESGPGIIELPDGSVGMRWALQTLVAHRN